MNIQDYLIRQRRRVEETLELCFPKPQPPFEDHIKAMRYSLFAGGKRIRPILCLAAGDTIAPCPQTEQILLPIACALECIHTYSLIHDDLPAMDDDHLRRGKPTNHILFGEAEAILAGDGLLTYAFELMTGSSSPQLDAERLLAITHRIARAAGPFGMVGGQALDIAHENAQYPIETLRTIHRNKTGALIAAAVEVGAIGAGAGKAEQAALKVYGEKIGLAFQIVDDLLDATATTQQLGKKAGSDALLGKATYPAFYGTRKTRELAHKTTNEAKDALSMFSDSAQPLRRLADYLYSRTQ